MEYTQPAPEFRPVTITLNSLEEVVLMRSLIGRTSPRDRHDYLVAIGLAPTYTGPRDTIHPVAYEFGNLYRFLEKAEAPS